jgi:hypothetical protein
VVGNWVDQREKKKVRKKVASKAFSRVVLKELDWVASKAVLKESEKVD